jgi:hypothetical protein
MSPSLCQLFVLPDVTSIMDGAKDQESVDVGSDGKEATVQNVFLILDVNMDPVLILGLVTVNQVGQESLVPRNSTTVTLLPILVKMEELACLLRSPKAASFASVLQVMREKLVKVSRPENNEHSS